MSTPWAAGEISAAGAVLGGRRFAPGAHPQAEGLTVTRGATLLISDEARGQPARITVYPAAARAPRPSDANDEGKR